MDRFWANETAPSSKHAHFGCYQQWGNPTAATTSVVRLGNESLLQPSATKCWQACGKSETFGPRPKGIHLKSKP